MYCTVKVSYQSGSLEAFFTAVLPTCRQAAPQAASGLRTKKFDWRYCARERETKRKERERPIEKKERRERESEEREREKERGEERDRE